MANKKFYSRYPPDWFTRIRPAILARANNCCERCGLPNHAVGVRDDNGAFQEINFGVGLPFNELKELGRASGLRVFKIVLTIAHINDPNPMNCREENLEALCQKCHLKIDRPMHLRKQKKNRLAKKKQATLFDC